MTKEDIKLEYHRLVDDNNFPANADKRRRGRDFEKLIYNLMALEKLEPKISFRPEGEEIDGSFLLFDKVFLFEAKWHKSPVPASSIYQFKGKVDGKLTGTIGLFISMSGFSGEAVDALTYGKSINIILFDDTDFSVCVTEENGFRRVLEKKLRIATERGTPFYSMKSLEVESKKSPFTKQISVSQTTSVNLTESQSGLEEVDEVVIVVEGHGDQEVIAYLSKKILEHANIKRNIKISPAGGKYSMARLTNAINDFSEGKIKFILIADSDFDVDETRSLLLKNLDVENVTLIIPDPEIEIWFQQGKVYDRGDLIKMAKDRKTEINKVRQYLLNKIEIESLKSNNESFRMFYDALIT